MSFFLSILTLIAAFLACIFLLTKKQASKSFAMITGAIILVSIFLSATGFIHKLSGRAHMSTDAIMLHTPAGGVLVGLSVLAIFKWANRSSLFGTTSPSIPVLISHVCKSLFFLSIAICAGSILVAMYPLFGEEHQKNLLFIHVVSSWAVIFTVTGFMVSTAVNLLTSTKQKEGAAV